MYKVKRAKVLTMRGAFINQEEKVNSLEKCVNYKRNELALYRKKFLKNDF